jgi:hypothetical protein
MATKAEQIYEEINQMVEGGMTKADAFKQMAEEQSKPVDSIRGAYYGHKRKIEGGDNTPRSRTRRRETTADDALADARSALEKSLANIDKEIEAAQTRAQEAAAEYESIRGSADERKAAISERLENLK